MDRAIADFSELIRIDPASSAAFIDRGQAYRRKGELDLAIADLDRAIAIKQSSPSAWFNRGITYSDRTIAEQSDPSDRARLDSRKLLQ